MVTVILIIFVVPVYKKIEDVLPREASSFKRKVDVNKSKSRTGKTKCDLQN